MGSVFVPEHRLNPLTPLGNKTPLSVTIGAVTITEVVDTALASIATRAGQGAAVAAVAARIGLPLPDPARWEQGPVLGAFWLGIDQWMAEAPFNNCEDIASMLGAEFGACASITEQTDGWARFDLTGPDLMALFERLCAVDLRQQIEGTATRTVIEHLGCYLILRTRRHVSVIGPRSAAASLHHALTTAARSVG